MHFVADPAQPLDGTLRASIMRISSARTGERIFQQCDVNYFEIRRAIGMGYRRVLRIS